MSEYDKWKNRRKSSNVEDVRSEDKKKEFEKKNAKAGMDYEQMYNTRIRSKHPLTHTADVQTILGNSIKNAERDAAPEKVGLSVKNKKVDAPATKLEKIDSDKQPAVREATTSTKLPRDRGTSKKEARLPKSNVTKTQVTPGDWMIDDHRKGKK